MPVIPFFSRKKDEMHTQNWFIEFRANRSNLYRIEQTEVSTTSKYQEILIATVQGYGKALFLDGVPQSSSLDEYIYHETLIHPALVAHPHPTKVWIAGGGEGAVLREIVKHKTIERVVMVDIDQVVVDLARTHLSAWHQGAFEDPRVEVVHEDARAYLANTQETFDCIVMDLTDPFVDGVAAPLFTREFFTLAKSHLREGGILSMQAEVTDPGSDQTHIALVKTLESCFRSVLPYQAYIPFYGLHFGFAIASEGALDRHLSFQNIAQTLLERGCTDLRFYDEETHQHLFARPKYLRSAAAEAILSEGQTLAFPRHPSEW
jgi:spermidine synthase